MESNLNVVEQAAVVTGRSVASLFERAIHEKHFTNGDEVFRYRFGLYLKKGEIPLFVREYCELLIN